VETVSRSLNVKKISYPAIEELQTLDFTERGADGFGATGTA